jgi:hypothetical protein
MFHGSPLSQSRSICQYQQGTTEFHPSIAAMQKPNYAIVQGLPNLNWAALVPITVGIFSQALRGMQLTIKAALAAFRRSSPSARRDRMTAAASGPPPMSRRAAS